MKKPRVPISAPQAGLQSPFASLEIPNLPEAPFNQNQSAAVGQSAGRVVLRREKSHRGGKTVIVVADFPSHVSSAQIEELARMARRECGCGGTVRGREIELQGDQPQRIRAFFEKVGYRVAGI